MKTDAEIREEMRKFREAKAKEEVKKRQERSEEAARKAREAAAEAKAREVAEAKAKALATAKANADKLRADQQAQAAAIWATQIAAAKSQLGNMMARIKF
jgi:hypothetical protein